MATPHPPRSRPRLAVTLGDPRGIGPEIVAKALADPAARAAAEFLVIGAEGAGCDVDLATGSWYGRAAGDVERAGALAGLAIERGVELAMRGEVDALVTAPIEKYAFRVAGFPYPGHTEMLQALAGAETVGMMLAAERTLLGGALRVVLATTHHALRDVPALLSAGLLVRQTRLTAAALRDWWGVAAPRIALCAFNPHASDGGLFGDEEARIYAPAVAELRDAGIETVGPVPADTVFLRAGRGEFDAVVAPYHDVGMAAFKTAAFGSGVNVTLGLPFPRTSPDHGTALDIAGRGVADAGSMLEAILLAVRLAGRFDTSGRLA